MYYHKKKINQHPNDTFNEFIFGNSYSRKGIKYFTTKPRNSALEIYIIIF